MLDLKPGDEDRKTTVKYKNLLRQHGLINGNWQKFIRRGPFSSRYALTDWVHQEFAKCRGMMKAAWWLDRALDYFTTLELNRK